MHLPLKFATDIIRPWEKLNTELINQNSIDRNISDFISIVANLAVKISHFPEIANQKHIRTNKSSHDFNIIVDIADASKHSDSNKEERNNKLSISSMFEGNDEGTFRFIRNKIVVEHNKYGKSDFLEISKKAAQFLFLKLNLPLIWNPQILEAPKVFTEKVFLNIYFTHQIAWTGLSIEFVKKNTAGELIPYDPPTWLFEMHSPLAINAPTYFDYIVQLIQKSVNNGIEIKVKAPFLLSDSFSTETFIADISYNDSDKQSENITVIQILENKDCSLSEIYEFQKVLSGIGADRIILVSEKEFTREIKEIVSNSISNIYLITINKLDAENIPLGFFKIKYKHNNIRMTAINKTVLGVLKEDEHLFAHLQGKPINELGDNFSLDKVNLISFKSLCLSHVKNKDNKINGQTSIKYKPRDKTNIFLKINDTFVKIGIEVDFEWASENNELHMPILVFNKSELGVSLWNLETYFNSPNGVVELKISVTKYGDTSAIGML
jgi:hypothetical protein